MLALPAELTRRYEALLTQWAVAGHHRPHYLKWLRYYWDFCHKYTLEPADPNSFPAFEAKLRARNQPDFQRQQAQQAISLYYEVVLTGRDTARQPSGKAQGNGSGPVRLDVTATVPRPTAVVTAATGVRPSIMGPSGPRQDEAPARILHPCSPPGASSRPSGQAGDLPRRTQPSPVQQVSQTLPRDPVEYQLTGASWISVYDGLNSAVAVRHYSPKTLQAYRHWTRKFQGFTKSKDPRLLSNDDVKGFLNFLAVDKKVAASSQNQAFNALLFLYTHVLEKEFGKVEGVVRAKRRKYIPVVLSRAEVDRVIRCLESPYDLVVKLLYGCGLRLFECLKLRVQDLNFEMKVLTVHDGKGQKDRTVPLLQVLVPELRAQLETVMRVHRDDLAAGFTGTFLPGALREKYKRAETELVWQWLFPAKTLTQMPATRELRRYHLHETHVQKAIKRAVYRIQIPKRVSAHCFRHSFASHLLQANYEFIRAIRGPHPDGAPNSVQNVNPDVLSHHTGVVGTQ